MFSIQKSPGLSPGSPGRDYPRDGILTNPGLKKTKNVELEDIQNAELKDNMTAIGPNLGAQRSLRMLIVGKKCWNGVW